MASKYDWKSRCLAAITISILQHKISSIAVKYGGELVQQWVVNFYLQVEANNLNYIRTQQDNQKGEQYQAFADHLTNTENTEDTWFLY